MHSIALPLAGIQWNASRGIVMFQKLTRITWRQLHAAKAEVSAIRSSEMDLLHPQAVHELWQGQVAGRIFYCRALIESIQPNSMT
jgi:hypothetical protein